MRHLQQLCLPGLAFQAAFSAALCFLACSLQGCNEINVDFETTCTDGSAAGAVCKTWLMKGQVQSWNVQNTFQCSVSTPNAPGCKLWQQSVQLSKVPDSGCFPGNAVVITRQGPTFLADVRMGDELLGVNPETGSPEFSPVLAWLHRDVDTELPMTTIFTSEGRVLASPSHNLAIRASDGQGHRYAFARDVQPGQVLVAANGTSVRVVATDRELAKGLYSPWTGLANFFAGASANSAVLAHSFAHLRRPERFEGAVKAAMSLAETLFPDLHKVDQDVDRSYVHPVMRLLAPLGGVDLRPQEARHVFLLGGSESEEHGRRLAPGAAAAAAAASAEMLRLTMLLGSLIPPTLLDG